MGNETEVSDDDDEKNWARGTVAALELRSEGEKAYPGRDLEKSVADRRNRQCEAFRDRQF